MLVTLQGVLLSHRKRCTQWGTDRQYFNISTAVIGLKLNDSVLSLCALDPDFHEFSLILAQSLKALPSDTKKPALAL